MKIGDGASMDSRDGNRLSSRQERLLGRFFDGECRFWEKLAAGRLVRTSPAARAYLDSLKGLREACAPRRAADVDLWSRISARIEQEQRSAILLGKRELNASWHERISGFRERFGSRMAWGVSGAFAAACAGFLALSIDAPGKKGTPELVADAKPAASSNLQLVSEHSGKAGTPKIIDPSYPVALEVDWMRSDGRVSLMQDPARRSAIIWVKKRRTGRGEIFDSRPASPEEVFLESSSQGPSWTVLSRNDGR